MALRRAPRNDEASSHRSPCSRLFQFTSSPSPHSTAQQAKQADMIHMALAHPHESQIYYGGMFALSALTSLTPPLVLRLRLACVSARTPCHASCEAPLRAHAVCMVMGHAPSSMQRSSNNAQIQTPIDTWPAASPRAPLSLASLAALSRRINIQKTQSRPPPLRIGVPRIDRLTS